MGETTTFKKGYVVGNTFETFKLAVYRSENGSKWEPVDKLMDMYPAFNANHVLVKDTSLIFIVGLDTSSNKGFLLWTDDESSWHLQQFDNEVFCVSVKDKQIWISANNSTLYMKEDYSDPSKAWQEINLHKETGAPDYLLMQGIECFEAGEICAVGNANAKSGNGGIFRLSSSNTQWQELTPPPPKCKHALNYIGVTYKSKNEMFFNGPIGLVLKYDNGVWHYIQEPIYDYAHDMNDLFLIAEDNIWLANDYNVFHYDGTSLNDMDIDTGGCFMLGIHALETNVWACGGQGKGAPTNGILTWSSKSGQEGSWNAIPKIDGEFMSLSIC